MEKSGSVGGERKGVSEKAWSVVKQIDGEALVAAFWDGVKNFRWRVSDESGRCCCRTRSDSSRARGQDLQKCREEDMLCGLGLVGHNNLLGPLVDFW